MSYWKLSVGDIEVTQSTYLGFITAVFISEDYYEGWETFVRQKFWVCQQNTSLRLSMP